MRRLLVAVLAVMVGATGPPAGPAPASAADPAVTSGAAADRADEQTVSRGEKGPPTPFDDGLQRAFEAGRLSRAEYALERARSLFRPGAAERRFGSVAEYGPHDATPILRDLVLQAPNLAGADRRSAGRLLARPDDGSDPVEHHYTVPSVSTCDAASCVHWVESTADAPVLTDSDADGVPDWVETTQGVVAQVRQKEVTDYGYRAPKSDLTSANHGPDGRLDVYLADVGADGLYGYCTTDDPNATNPSYPFWDVSAYCVVDEDFATDQFGAPPLNSLRVAVAHELFHAVQYAYDFGEDLWLVEGTAAWMEDEVYDSVNDNLQYLAVSPLQKPGVPVDRGSGGHEYGAWIFWRYLSERFGPGAGADPSIVRQTWERADGSAAGPDAYSMQALRQVVTARGVSFRGLFGHFGAVNHVARGWYSEGGSYPNTPLAATYTLTNGTRSTGWRSSALKHLSNRNVAARAGSSLTGAWRLRVALNLPNTSRGSVATVTVHRADGTLSRRQVTLDSSGGGTTTTAFSRSSVRRVVLTLTSASASYRCFQDTVYSCTGTPLDDGLTYQYRLSAIR